LGKFLYPYYLSLLELRPAFLFVFQSVLLYQFAKISPPSLLDSGLPNYQIKDLYDNYIVSYKTAASQDYGLVDRTLRAAVVSEGTHSGLILHSDQGAHYTAFSYKYFVDENDIIPSMSRPGTPLDNACAENFFSILKCECIYRQKIKSLKEAQELVDEYIDYYNFQNKTGLTPYEQRQAAYAA